MPPFQFKPHIWYRGRARKPFSWMSLPDVPPLQTGTPIYFKIHPCMHEHWIVFDGMNTVVGMSLDRMKEYVESEKNNQGYPAEANSEMNMKLNTRLEMWVKG